MVSGVPPREASDRLAVFQSRFDTLFRKYQTYTAGEVLFGLAVTQYPQLLEVGKELSLLQKLYGLYNDVVDTVSGYHDVLWQDVSVDKITSELQEFQNKSEAATTLQLHCTCFMSFRIGSIHEGHLHEGGEGLGKHRMLTITDGDSTERSVRSRAPF